jgi:hypothetical protein
MPKRSRNLPHSQMLSPALFNILFPLIVPALDGQNQAHQDEVTLAVHCCALAATACYSIDAISAMNILWNSRYQQVSSKASYSQRR